MPTMIAAAARANLYRLLDEVADSHDPVQIAGEAAEVSANALTYDLNAKKIVLTGSVAAAVSRNFTPARGLNKR